MRDAYGDDEGVTGTQPHGAFAAVAFVQRHVELPVEDQEGPVRALFIL